MNRTQEFSLTGKEAPSLAGMIDDVNDTNVSEHAKTQAMIGELLTRAGQPGAKLPPISFGGVTLNREYYSLFVVGDEKFDKGSFTISKERSLVEYIETDVKKKFYELRDDRVVEQILTLPSLFMSENVDFMRSRAGQKAFLGRVTEIEIGLNDFKISFEADVRIFQQSLTEISHDLAINGSPGLSELNRSHWTIKQVDLIKVLTESGLLNAQSSQK